MYVCMYMCIGTLNDITQTKTFIDTCTCCPITESCLYLWPFTHRLTASAMASKCNQTGNKGPQTCHPPSFCQAKTPLFPWGCGVNLGGNLSMNVMVPRTVHGAYQLVGSLVLVLSGQASELWWRWRRAWREL